MVVLSSAEVVAVLFVLLLRTKGFPTLAVSPAARRFETSYKKKEEGGEKKMIR